VKSTDSVITEVCNFPSYSFSFCFSTYNSLVVSSFELMFYSERQLLLIAAILSMFSSNSDRDFSKLSNVSLKSSFYTNYFLFFKNSSLVFIAVTDNLMLLIDLINSYSVISKLKILVSHLSEEA